MNRNEIIALNNAIQRALIPVVEMMDTDETINFHGAWLDVEGEEFAMITFNYKPVSQMQPTDYSAFKDDMMMVSQLLVARQKNIKILGITDRDGQVRMILGLE